MKQLVLAEIVERRWVKMAEDKIAYCVKCKHKVKVQDPKEVTMKNGMPAVKGTCSECGTKVFAIQKKK